MKLATRETFSDVHVIVWLQPTLNFFGFCLTIFFGSENQLIIRKWHPRVIKQWHTKKWRAQCRIQLCILLFGGEKNVVPTNVERNNLSNTENFWKYTKKIYNKMKF